MVRSPCGEVFDLDGTTCPPGWATREQMIQWVINNYNDVRSAGEGDPSPALEKIQAILEMVE